MPMSPAIPTAIAYRTNLGVVSWSRQIFRISRPTMAPTDRAAEMRGVVDLLAVRHIGQRQE